MKSKKLSVSLALLSFLSMLLISCSPSPRQQLLDNAKNYMPSAEDRQAIIEEVEDRIDQVDPAYNALKVFRPLTANHYHSKMIGMDVHPTRTTAQFAVRLLETEIPEYQEQAFALLRSLIEAQDQDPGNDTYGIWPYHFEEPLEQMHRPDWNWADFVSVQLLDAYMKYHDVVPEDLLEDIETSLIHASNSIRKRDVKPGYTNIAIMGTLVTHLTSRLFDLPEMKEYADMRMKRFYDFTLDLNGFQEYNSPTYTRVALDELIRMKQYIVEPEILAMADSCYAIGWDILARRFHVPTGQLSGPHSRCYSTLARDRFHDMLLGASAGRVKYGAAERPADYYKLRHRIPSYLMHYFLEAGKPRIEIDTFSLRENPPVGYTCLTPLYSAGTVNRATTWKQRRPYLVYWGEPDNPRYLAVRLRHDEEDFGIGNIFSVQDRNEILTGMNFAVNGGDYHISIDRLEEGKFRAEEVRLRFEMWLDPEKDELVTGERGFRMRNEKLEIRVELLYTVFGNEAMKTASGREGQLHWFDLVIYAGPEKEFDLTAIDEALIAWQTMIHETAGESADPAHFGMRKEGTMARLSSGRLALSLPFKPDEEAVLQRSFSMER